MILAIDVGNTNIVVGCLDRSRTYFVERLSTVRTKTELEYAVDFRTVLDIPPAYLSAQSPDELRAHLL